LEKELKQRLAELEKQKSFMIKMESFKRTRLEQLQGVKQDFNVSTVVFIFELTYLQFPDVSVVLDIRRGTRRSLRLEIS
jgi:hypothetical protein